MNKLLLLAFLVTLLALAAAGSQEEEEEEGALTRLAREADPARKELLRKGRKKCKNNKCNICQCGTSGCRRNPKACKSKSGKGFRSGKAFRAGGKGKRKCMRACNGKSVAAKKKCLKDCKNENAQGRTGTRQNGKTMGNNGGCNRAGYISSTSTCLVNSMTYQNLTRLQIANYLKQHTRMTKANSTGTNKHGKKGIFATTAMRIIKSGGGNKSALACNGNTNSSGAAQLTNVTNTLLECEAKIKAACDSSNLGSLLPNITEVNACKTAMTTFVGMVDVCMMIMNETAACSCWDNAEFTTLANTTIRGCKHSSENSKVTKQLKYCKGNFSACKQAEDDGMQAMSSCASSTASLLADAAALTANSAGLAAASNTTSSLTGSSNSTGRHTRAVVTSCADVITNIAKILVIVNEMATSTEISTLAATVTGVSVTCTSTEITSLTTQATSLATAKESVDAQLATVQADLLTATGSTASSSDISAAAASSSATAAASSRRNIVARHLLNRLNLN